MKYHPNLVEAWAQAEELDQDFDMCFSEEADGSLSAEPEVIKAMEQRVRAVMALLHHFVPADMSDYEADSFTPPELPLAASEPSIGLLCTLCLQQITHPSPPAEELLAWTRHFDQSASAAEKSAASDFFFQGLQTSAYLGYSEQALLDSLTQVMEANGPLHTAARSAIRRARRENK